VKILANADGQAIDQDVDTNMGSRCQRMGKPPRKAESKHVACNLGGGARGETAEVAANDIDGDERGAENEIPARHIVHERRYGTRGFPYRPRKFRSARGDARSTFIRGV